MALLIFALISVLLLIKIKENQFLEKAPEKMIYFFGKTCPHCVGVEKFFKENEIEKKFQFEKREVFYNEANKRLLILLAEKKCNLKEDKIGVPLFWTGSECFVGEKPIVDFFKEKLQSKI